MNSIFYKVVFGGTMAIIAGGYIAFTAYTLKSQKKNDKIYEEVMEKLRDIR